MNLGSRKIIKKLFFKYNVRPSKKLGQNFLIDNSVLKNVIQSANLKKNDTILEIGPGIGTLTFELAKNTKKVITIEKDKRMCEILKDLSEYLNIRNIEIINKDILRLNLRLYTLKPYKVIANLPYYIVSPVIRKFLEAKNPPKEMILMVQKEVAKRICAKPPKMSLLAVSVQFYAKPEILFYVSKNSFWPQPKVDSAVIKLKIKNLKFKINKNLFFKIVKAGFSQPRKQLVNNLSKMLKLTKEEVKRWLSNNRIKPTQRAETLKLQDWIKLTRDFQWK